MMVRAVWSLSCIHAKGSATTLKEWKGKTLMMAATSLTKGLRFWLVVHQYNAKVEKKIEKAMKNPRA